jgi:hypothetical protein
MPAAGALCAGLATVAGLRLRGRPLGPAGIVSLGAALAIGSFLGPRIPHLTRGIIDASLGPGLTFAGVWLGLALLARVAGDRRFLEPVAALAGIAASMAFVAATLAAVRPQQAAEPGALAEPAPDAPRAVVLVLDTVGASHLSLYGYERATTPSLERFVEEHPRAVVYPWAFASSPWTVPSHATLLTGELGSRHGAHYRAREESRSPLTVLEVSAERTLAEAVAESGGRSALITANTYLRRVRGLERGFERFIQPRYPRSLATQGEQLRQLLLPSRFAFVHKHAPGAETIHREVLRFLEGCSGRCLVVANFMEAHTPYLPAPPFAGRFGGGTRGASSPRIDHDAETRRATLARYDESILELDAELGAFLEKLVARSDFERTWLVITADHGEAFGTHRWVGHGSAVFNDQVRIPLLIHPPAGVTLPDPEHPVGLPDVTATLAAALTGAPLGRGRDLRQPGSEAAHVGIEFFGGNPPLSLADLEIAPPPPARAVVIGPHKLMDQEGTLSLFDLSIDPDERNALEAPHPDHLAELQRSLPPLRATALQPADPLSPADREALRALGYIE